MTTSNQFFNKYTYFFLDRFSANIARNRQSFNDAIVFMVGGGNYIEYQNLQDYVKPRPPAPPRRIVYGCTELVNASQFLEQVKIVVVLNENLTIVLFS